MTNKRLVIGLAAATFVIVTLTLTYFVGGVGGACASRDDVSARVSMVSSGLQEAAAQGKITVERLAEGIKRLNGAATAYESTQDHQAYCDSLDALNKDYAL